MSWLRTTKEDAVLAIDMGTASTSAVLFVYEDKNKVDIIKVLRRRHKHSISRDSHQFQKSALNEASELLKDVEKSFRDYLPKEIRIGVAAPFYLAKTVSIHQERDENKAIEDKELEVIARNGEQETKKAILGQNLEVFETNFLQTQLNGYDVNNIIGRKSRDITATIRYAALQKEFLEDLNKRFSYIFPSAKIHFFTFPVLYLSMLKQIIKDKKTALIIDLGGETTEVSLIKNNVIEKVFSIPFGILTLASRMQDMSGIDIDTATALLKSYASGTLSEKESIRIKEIIMSESSKWQSAFKNIMKHVSPPVSILFLGGGSWFEDLKEIILSSEDIKKNSELVFISNVSPSAFKEKIGEWKELAGPEDFGLLGLILGAANETLQT
ncbi:hypothetical protein ACFL3E_01130 [Patescibacteria group bacterium]